MDERMRNDLLGESRTRQVCGGEEGAEAGGDPVEFARRMGFEADEVQASILRSTAKQGILNCTRQWGKSTVAGAKAIWQMVSKPACLVVVASPSKK